MFPAAGVVRPHGVEHLAGEPQVEERVDQQPGAAARDQPGVGPAPPAVGLQVGPDPVGDLVETLGVRHVRGRASPSSPGGIDGSASSVLGVPRAALGFLHDPGTFGPATAAHREPR